MNILTQLEYCIECYNMGRNIETFDSLQEIIDQVGEELVNDWLEEYSNLK